MPRDEQPRWFVDETSLGLAKALAAARGDVLHPGHRRLPEVPLSTVDPEWMPVVARLGLVVIGRDRHLRTKSAERQAFVDHRLRVFRIAGDRDMSTWDNLRLVAKFWDRMERIVESRPDGPWFYELFATTITELRVMPRMPRPAPPHTQRRVRGGQLDLGI